ncbi:hypothetical protein F5Y19DRAFT_230029 [Xylariaceae sp. FL1651]|nr:hypothetical protein F5Y19DRAFT_230029 [Xylariaceae sp. FL1651]
MDLMGIILFIIFFISEVLWRLWTILRPAAVVGIFISWTTLRISQFGLPSEWLPPAISHTQYLFPNAEPLAWRYNGNVTDLRVLVNAGTPRAAVKYLTAGPDVNQLKGTRLSRYSRTKIIHMPVLPEGGWNCADIGLAAGTKELTVTSVSCADLPGVANTWHPSTFEYVDLVASTLTSPLKPASRNTNSTTDRFRLVESPLLNSPGHLGLMKIANFPVEIPAIEMETQIYKHMAGLIIVPEFLGHVVENGRVIGFVTPALLDARPASEERPLTAETQRACHSALELLHKAGVVHGDARYANCMLRPHDGIAFWMNFEHARIMRIKEKILGTKVALDNLDEQYT